MDGLVERGDIGEGLMGEVMRLEIVPDDFDVVELLGVFWQPLDGEPVRASREGRERELTDVDRSSLSAFSASVTNDVAGGNVPGASPVQPVRAQSTASQSQAPIQKLSPQALQSTPPSQTLPRGSLLDLSV
ncbi:MAG TPA: hypothetical protein VGH36_08120 [Acetobacteraceae bacterium]